MSENMASPPVDELQAPDPPKIHEMPQSLEAWATSGNSGKGTSVIEQYRLQQSRHSCVIAEQQLRRISRKIAVEREIIRNKKMLKRLGKAL
jgi:membrane-bound lytic murein transglycosylase B